MNEFTAQLRYIRPNSGVTHITGVTSHALATHDSRCKIRRGNTKQQISYHKTTTNDIENTTGVGCSGLTWSTSVMILLLTTLLFATNATDA
jgi:hypothetical protein